MLEASSNSASRRRLSQRSVTSAPVTQKEDWHFQEKSKAKAKESAQQMAKNQLVAQQKQALERQESKLTQSTMSTATSLGAFLSNNKDDDSVDSEDEDMFSMFQWSIAESAQSAGISRSVSATRSINGHSMMSSRSLGAHSIKSSRSMSVPRIRIDNGKRPSDVFVWKRD